MCAPVHSAAGVWWNVSTVNTCVTCQALTNVAHTGAMRVLPSRERIGCWLSNRTLRARWQHTRRFERHTHPHLTTPTHQHIHPPTHLHLFSPLAHSSTQHANHCVQLTGGPHPLNRRDMPLERVEGRCPAQRRWHQEGPLKKQCAHSTSPPSCQRSA